MVVHQNITNLAGYFHFLNVRKIPYVIKRSALALGGSRWDAGRAMVGKWTGGQGAWPGGTRAWQMFGKGLSQSGRHAKSDGQAVCGRLYQQSRG